MSSARKRSRCAARSCGTRACSSALGIISARSSVDPASSRGISVCRIAHGVETELARGTNLEQAGEAAEIEEASHVVADPVQGQTAPSRFDLLAHRGQRPEAGAADVLKVA